MRTKKGLTGTALVTLIMVVILIALLSITLYAKYRHLEVANIKCGGEGGAGIVPLDREGTCRKECDRDTETHFGAGTVENQNIGCPPKEDNPETEVDERTLVYCCLKV